MLTRGRVLAESLMTDTLTITRATEPTFSESTGTYTPGTPTAVYSGKGRVQTYEPFESTPEAGAHTYTVQRYTVQVPSTVVAAIDDTITVTASVTAPDLVGREYIVKGLLHKSHKTANRLLVDEVVA